MSVDLTQLTPRRQKFIALALLYGHEKGGHMRAFAEAGYKIEGSNHPDIMCAKLLKHPDVAAALAAARGDMAEKFSISQDRVLRELALIAFSDIKHYSMSDSGELEVDADEDISPHVTRAVSSVEYTTTTEGERVTRKMKLRLWDKNAGLTLLMKYLGMLVDRSVNTNITAKMTMDEARKLIQSANAPSTEAELDFAWQRAEHIGVDDIARLPQEHQQEREIDMDLPHITGE